MLGSLRFLFYGMMCFMKRLLMVGVLGLALFGAGCASDVPSSPAVPERRSPPVPPKNIPLPTPVQPIDGNPSASDE